MWRSSLLLAGALVACAGSDAPADLHPLAAGQRVESPALALSRGVTLARGTLGYASAFAGERYLVSVELATSFELVIRDLADSTQRRELARVALGQVQYDVERVAVDQDRGRAFVASSDGRVRGYAIPTGAELVSWHLGSPVTAVAIAPDGELVAMGTSDGILCLRRYRDGALLQCALAHDTRISDLDFSATGEELASASWRGEVVRWRVPTLAEDARRSFPGAVCALAFAPRSRRLAIARSAFPPMRTPEVAARERRVVADGASGHLVSLWTPEQRADLDLAGHEGPVTDVVWTPDGRRLATSSWDRTVRLWDASHGRELHRITGFSALVHDLAMDRAGRWLAVAAWTDGRAGRSIALLELLYPRTSSAPSNRSGR